LEEEIMDKDRIEGSAKEIKGKTKEVAGKMLGDAKLESEGKADQAAGRIQNGRQRHAQGEVTAAARFPLAGPHASQCCQHVPKTVRATC